MTQTLAARPVLVLMFIASAVPAFLQSRFTSGSEPRVFHNHTGIVAGVAFSPDGERLASTGGPNSTATVWNVASGEVLLRLEGHQRDVTAVVFSSEGKRLATGSNDGTIRIWDATSGTSEMILRANESIDRVLFSPDGQRVISSGHPILVWDTTRGQKVTSIFQPFLVARSMVITPDGKRIISGSMDGKINVWATATGEPLDSFAGQHPNLLCLALSPDGKRIGTGGGDKKVKLWDALTGEELVTMEGHGGRILSVAFSPDGQRIAAVGREDEHVRVWEVATGRERLTLASGVGGMLSVVFSPDGRWIAASSEGIHVWKLDGE